MSDVLYINDTDISDLGLVPLDLSDWWSPPRATRAAFSLYGMQGSLPSPVGIYEPRRLALGLMLDSDSLSDRRSDVDAVHRQTRGLLEIRVGDDSARVGYAVMEGMPTAGMWAPHVWHQMALRAQPELVFYDPTKYDRDQSVLAISSTPATVPMGTASIGGIYTIHGAATAPVLRARSFGGELITNASMTFANLAADEALEIDMSAQTITFYDSGVTSNGLASKLTAGWFFGLDPADEPTIEVTSGVGELRYRRRWLS